MPTRSDGSKFELNLLPDQGLYLELQATAARRELLGQVRRRESRIGSRAQRGRAMLGQVAFDGKDRFNFKLVGAPLRTPD